MAIYDTGTASLSANGQVTGVGTQWTMPLTLIRAGATLVFKTEPVQIYTISEITSDTSLSVYNPKGETVAAGTGYAILAHDGISVQGLAQDVAETLRYYQSRETEVADAVDAFNNFDSADFELKVAQVDTQHGDVVSIGAQVSSDASQVSSDKDSAAASALSASRDKDAAAISAQQAADYASSLDTQNLLKKDLSLSDLTDKPLARQNLDVYSKSESLGIFGSSPYFYGAVGDGVTDDTLALQAYIDATSGDIDLSGGTYLVSKNPSLATTYPTEADFSNGGYNFSPCLAIVNKNNVKIYNGTLLVKTHGLDALSLVNCKNVTVSLKIQGPGKFPAIDPTTGYAEKGEANFGYDSAQVLGPNNGVDTSGYTSGAYSGVTGQFPNYNADGSQAAGFRATWGKFLNGNIGSWACGVKVQRACKGILITGCELSNFNFGGVGIGIRNAAAAYGASDYTTESDVPDGVLVVNSTISNCYSAGIYVLSGYRLNYDSNIITDIGHPDGNDVTNASYDPGYGITHGRNRRIRNVSVTNNQIRNCRRKAIDFHGGGQAIITGNFCLEHGVVGIYAKCGVGWSPNYECYNLIIANNYTRSRDIPPSETTGLLAGAKYTRSIDVGGGGEATQATYPEPFVKILNNYCELKSYDGVGITTGAGDSSYVVFNDIDISHNTVVMKYSTNGTSNTSEGLTVNAGADSDTVYRAQKVKIIGNTVKQFNSLSSAFRVAGFKVQGIPKTLTAVGNTLDCNVVSQTGLLASFVLDSRTSFEISGNSAVSYSTKSSVGIQDVIFYDNVKVTRPAGAAALTIPGTLYRGIWDLSIAGGGDYFGSRNVRFASTGSAGTAAEVVRNPTSGGIASFGMSVSGLTCPAVTEESPIQINLKLICGFDSVN